MLLPTYLHVSTFVWPIALFCFLDSLLPPSITNRILQIITPYPGIIEASTRCFNPTLLCYASQYVPGLITTLCTIGSYPSQYLIFVATPLATYQYHVGSPYVSMHNSLVCCRATSPKAELIASRPVKAAPSDESEPIC